MKTWKAAKKRIKLSKKKKILKKQAGQNHFNTKQRGKTIAGKRKKTKMPQKKSILKLFN